MVGLADWTESGRLANWFSAGSNKAQQSGLIRTRPDRITGTKLLVNMIPPGTLWYCRGSLSRLWRLTLTG